MEVKKSDIRETKTIGLGSGQWAIEVYDLDGRMVKRFQGSNGAHRDNPVADHLWSEFDNWFNSLKDTRKAPEDSKDKEHFQSASRRRK